LFVTSENPIAWRNLLCNIGAGGCDAAGAGSGVVIASPSKDNPDCKYSPSATSGSLQLTLSVDWYTWTRDSALVFKSVVDAFSANYSADLQTQIQSYIVAQARLQGVSNPSGSFSDGSGLAEPKFHVDLTQYAESWGEYDALFFFSANY
jgi:glucoamylase